MTPRLRVVVLACDGLYQRDLIARLSRQHQVVGVVIHAPPDAKGSLPQRLRRYLNPVTLLRHIQARLLMPGYAARARPLLEQLLYQDGRPPELPQSIPQLRVDNINQPEAVAFVRRLAPDVVCVNGTNLLREPMLELLPTIRLGIINLHTGLSPYSRGGNCDLFMLLEGRPELVGVTIHHIDRGIDSGDIILTARPELDAQDNYEMIEAKSFRLGNDLMLRALGQLTQGTAQRVKQWEEGKLFLRRTGYVYEPYHRVLVNRALAQGLVARYLADRTARDAGIRLVG